MKSLQNLSYKTLFTILFFAIAGIIFFLKIGGKVTKVSASWWNDSWHYRKSISVNNTGSNQSNVYLTISTDTSDTTKFQNDCGDIRFTNQDGNLLDYYIVSGCGTTATTIHTNFPTLISGNSTFYMYYGNSSADNGFSITDFSTAAIGSTPSLNNEETGGGPIAYWKFDEGSGTTAYDSASTNNGTLSGSTLPEWQIEENCISGKCLSFNETDSVVSIGTTLGTFSQYTISFWAKHNTSNNMPIASKGTTNFYWYGDNSWKYVHGGTSGEYYYPKSVSIPYGTWGYFVVTYDGEKVSIYRNGVLEGTKATTGTAVFNSGFYLGQWGNLNYSYAFNGLIDELKIYPYARTADQILTDYNSRGSLSGAGANLGVQSNTAPSIKSGLVAYYKFDENSGTKVNNSVNSGIGLSGVFAVGNSAPTWTQGKFGNALSFNGTTSYLSIPDSGTGSPIDLGQPEITVTAWIKPNTISAGSHTIVGKNAPYILWINNSSGNNRIYTFLYKGATWYGAFGASNQIQTGVWQYVAMTYSGTTRKHYYNGSLSGVENTQISGNIDTYNSPIMIGQDSNSRFFDGLIDEVKIYNKALTADEVKQDYNAGSSTQFGQTTQNIGGTTTSLDYCIPGDTTYCAAPVAEWKMDEGSGTSITDTSGNSNTGTLGTGNSAPTWVQGKIGKGMSFDGTNDYIQSSYTLSNTDDFTVSVWAKYATQTSDACSSLRTIFASGNPGASNGVGLSAARSDQGGRLYYSIYTETINSDLGFNDGNWHFMTLQRSGNSMIFFYDGKLISTTTITNNPATSGVQIGGSTSAACRKFHGLIDQVKIYNYARTPAQIAYDYNKGAPVAWWKMDECQGSTVYDWSDNDNNGTITIGASGSQNSLGTCQVGTSAAWTNGSSGKINSSLNLDGTNDYVLIPATETLNLINQLSFGGWVYPKSTATQNFLERTNSNSTGGSYSLYSSNGSGYVRFHLKKNSSWPTVITSNYQLPLNQWSHILATWDGSTAKLFINGKLDKSAPFTGPLDSNPSSTIGIGYSPWNNNYFVNGQIDDVRVYNYALTDEQIKQVYNNGAVNFQ